jgi:hypothetical protein
MAGRSHEASCLFSFRPPSLRALELVGEPLPPFQFSFLCISNAKTSQNRVPPYSESDTSSTPSRRAAEIVKTFKLALVGRIASSEGRGTTATYCTSHVFSTHHITLHRHRHHTESDHNYNVHQSVSTPPSYLCRSSRISSAYSLPHIRQTIRIGRTHVRLDHTCLGTGLLSIPASAFAVLLYEETRRAQVQV